MNTEMYSHARAIFQEANAKPSYDRAAFLDHACGGDRRLREDVDSWLAASNQTTSVIDTPAVKLCTTCDVRYAEQTRFCERCGQPLHNDPRALVGTNLDSTYVIEELLGTGGMGAVYRARHVLLGDRVAVKTLKRELSELPQFLKRFQREGQAARAFHHENAVTVHDLRMTRSGLVFMVLEYVRGTDLRGLLRSRGRFALDEALDILEPLASVLDAAHAKGIVHRDIKPENVMLADGGRGGAHVKLLDLGIAKLLEPLGDEPAPVVTEVDQVLGTPPYIPPEQWGAPPRDGGAQIDRRADVYSLAILTYELVTGAWPFPGRTLAEWRAQHLGSPVPDAHDRYGWVPEGVATVLARGMAKDRGDRHATAGELVADIRRTVREAAAADAHVREPGVTAFAAAPSIRDASVDTPPARAVETRSAVALSSPPSRSEMLPESERRSPSFVLARTAIAILAILAVGYLIIGPSRRPATADSAVTPSQPASAGPAAPSTPPEALRYWVEACGSDGAVAHATGLEPIPTAKAFRLHFFAQTAGYYYVIGRDKKEALTVFYTGAGRPPLAQGEEFVFPQSGWVRPSPGGTVDRATVIFSPSPLTAEQYLAARPPHTLTVDEIHGFESLVLTAAVEPDAIRATDDQRSVLVFARRDSEPLAVDLKIVHAP